MKEKILKISDDPLITSECWTYYKFAVMQTSTKCNIWLTNHFSVYLCQDGSALFGENGNMYPLSYYSDILDIRDGNILSVSSDDIIDYIKEKINQGYYIILDLNYNKLKCENENFWLHETLIYGYTQTEFATPILINGVFRQEKIAFDVVKSAYEDACKYYKEDLNRLYNRRAWFYGITLLRIKENFINENAYYDFIKKLRYEQEGNIYYKQKYSDSMNVKSKYFTGLSCIKHIIDLLNNIEYDNDVFSRLRKYREACKKISEHQNAICITMKWLRKSSTSSDLLEITDCYERSIKNITIIIMLFNKFELTADKSIIKRIIEKLSSVLMVQNDLLGKFISFASLEYIKKINH